MKQVLFDIVMKSAFTAMLFLNNEKKKIRQWKCTTSFIPRQNHNGEVVDRSWLCSSFTNLNLLFYL